MADAEKRPVPSRGMLPGMAAIAMFLLIVSMFAGFKMLRAAAVPSFARFSTLIISTLIVVGVFGFLRLRRWGWALVSGGCVLGAISNSYSFHLTHSIDYLVQGMFSLVFFLYLIRVEVRERVH